MLFKKQEIHSIDFTGTEGLNTEGWETWAESMQLSHLHQWLLPQLVAWYGSWTLVNDEHSNYDCLATVKLNCSDPKSRAFYMLSRIKRSLLVPQQTKTPDPRLLDALALSSEDLEVCGGLGSNRLLEIQKQGLTTKSGKTAGSIKPARSTWSLSGIQDTEIGHLPKLTQTILTQCWLAHPELRTPYMILDLQDWDSMPQPLVTNDIFKAVQTQQPTKTKELADVLPWDL